MPAQKHFLGFGFGPIQSALFLYEAYASGNFSRYVVAEVDAGLVAAVRASGGAYSINIARKDRIDQVEVRGVELYNPREEPDRARILDAVASADEIATALPSVKFFDSPDPASVAKLLGRGFAARDAARPAIVYAAENHNHAAEILQEKVSHYAPADALARVQFLNTVIGKMSGVIAGDAEIRRLGLAPMTPGASKAILVEEFNRILISRIALPGFPRGIDVFVEKDDLLPFEEAKLYGHNAIHALIGYLADEKGLSTMDQASAHPDIMATARAAFLDESGAALIAKYAHLGDPLFTADGYRAYADDLLDRMVRPNLNDLVARVIRDPARKLSYDDRIYGTMRLALRHDVRPRHMALGAAAAILGMIRHRAELPAPPKSLPASRRELTQAALAALLQEIWGKQADTDAPALIRLTWDALGRLP